LEAIRQRRMFPRVDERPPSREEIEQLLELAVRAPNHHATEPWRFYVLAGVGRERLARAIAEEAIEAGAEEARAVGDARKKVERAPVIVVFTCVPSQDDLKVIEQEEIASVAMAIQNFLLGAYASGLGAMLRTGTTAYHPAISRHLELAPGERVVGFVYLGYPAAERELTARAPAAERTRWFGFDSGR
jgi:nitroreductase